MTEKRQPRELLIAAIKHFDNAQGDFEIGTFDWPGRDASLVKFYELREAMLEALEPVFVPPADPQDELYNVAEDRWDQLKEAYQLAGTTRPLSALAARAFADAAEAAEAEWHERKGKEAA